MQWRNDGQVRGIKFRQCNGGDDIMGVCMQPFLGDPMFVDQPSRTLFDSSMLNTSTTSSS